MKAKAFAPGNISCIFKIYNHKNPRWSGSYGMGFTINEGVIAEVSNSNKMQVIFNNKKINFPTVNSSILKLTKEKLKVNLESKLPIGCGFGLSGASSLAALFAANKLLGTGKTDKELAIIAHTAEVENKSGLGDVVNQLYGGFLVKFLPSSKFIVTRLDVGGDVYCRYFGKISTKSIISDKRKREKINKSADNALGDLRTMIKRKNTKFQELIDLSYRFSMESGLLSDKKTMKTIEGIKKNGGHASMIMLGNAVFCDKKFKGASRFKISQRGACVL